MRLLSVDPGQRHVGLALWQDGTLEVAWEDTPAGSLGNLRDIDRVVVESFTLMSPSYSKQGAKQAVDTIKLIGMIHGICWLRGVEVLEQQPSVRHVAQRSPYWAPLVAEHRLPGNSHIRSAVAHGLYHLKFSKHGGNA